MFSLRRVSAGNAVASGEARVVRGEMVAIAAWRSRLFEALDIEDDRLELLLAQHAGEARHAHARSAEAGDDLRRGLEDRLPDVGLVGGDPDEPVLERAVGAVEALEVRAELRDRRRVVGVAGDAAEALVDAAAFLRRLRALTRGRLRSSA